MATLFVSKTTDFRGGAAEIDIDQIIFQNIANAFAIFDEEQFGPGLIENTVAITGGNATDVIDVAFSGAGSFTASGWKFTNWVGDDQLRIFGDTNDQTITGSTQGDFLRGGGGVDKINGGSGADTIQITDDFLIAAGTTIQGGGQAAGTFDRIFIDTGNPAVVDIRPAQISGVEELAFDDASTAIVSGEQIGAGLIVRVVANAGDSVTLSVLDDKADLSGVKFLGFDGDDSIDIEGTSTKSNVLRGSLIADKIAGIDASEDTITGGGGGDTLIGFAGSDNFQYFSGAEAVSGEVVIGGLGNDRLSLINAGAIDFTLVALSELEALDFLTGSSAATFDGKQIGGGAIKTVSGSLAIDKLVVTAVGQIADLSGVNFNTWTNGTDSIAVNGSKAADTLTGSSQNDTLDGKGGADTMAGGLGSDVYRVDNTGDAVNEEAGGGAIDRVITVVDYILTANSEIELFTTNSSSGTSAIDLTGNTLAQEIVGNAGDNILHDGGKGAADTLRGLGGNDTYRVFNAGDVIVESSAQGTADRVTAAVDYVLGTGVFIELFTTNGSGGTSDIDLTGNEIAQQILGNAGDNRLEGKGGADTLRGFGGKDSFAFATALGAGNIDTIVDFNVADDRFLLSAAIFTELDAGPLSGETFRANATGLAQDASDRIIYETDTGNVFYDEDGTGALAGIHFATITANLALTGADFLVE
ncbi:calcium-binding protein [Mesorhizobium sp. LHD-90]|uniref:beta strand repeat-containing protein n=1 Tax=Mesorhizobium sp. LHD-90 TaxID=3071414 RepID=UPI0027DEC43E|nr:calcium-binding protein [Mesorhizobium sp. LHD-90]MDQ6433014.1 calcium-binding protein [Mesorhizobium sp. LHD-90]